MAKTEPPTLIGAAQAADLYGVDRATFNRWVKAGRIPIALTMAGETGARLFDADEIGRLAADYAHPRKQAAS